MKRKILLGLLLVCLLLEMPLSYAIPDPSAEYCQGLGYDILVEETEEGQVGICKFPDGSSCPTWDFLRGKCGEDWSYCKQRGYEMKTTFIDEWSSNAVCVLPDGGDAGVLDLMRCEMAGGKWENEECKCPGDCTYLWYSCWIKTPIEACLELGGVSTQSFMVGPVGCNFLCLRDGKDITDLAREKAELLPTAIEQQFSYTKITKVGKGSVTRVSGSASAGIKDRSAIHVGEPFDFIVNLNIDDVECPQADCKTFSHFTGEGYVAIAVRDDVGYINARDAQITITDVDNVVRAYNPPNPPDPCSLSAELDLLLQMLFEQILPIPIPPTSECVRQTYIQELITYDPYTMNHYYSDCIGLTKDPSSVFSDEHYYDVGIVPWERIQGLSGLEPWHYNRKMGVAIPTTFDKAGTYNLHVYILFQGCFSDDEYAAIEFSVPITIKSSS